MPKKATKPIDFERSLQKLEMLVERMESGQMSLEDSLNAFETGIKLTRQCQTALAAAEQKVQLLMEKNGAISTVPFDELSEQDDSSQ